MHVIETIVQETTEEETAEMIQPNTDPNVVEPSSVLESESLLLDDSAAPPQDVPHETSGESMQETVDTPSADPVGGNNDEGLLNSEEEAIANAIASANSSYVPPTTVMHDPTPEPLLASIDGPSLASYDHQPSTYTARNIPVSVRSKLTVPIYVNNSGSIVEYTLESQYYDVGFGIVAEREDGATTVVELARVDSNMAPITGRFLVISVPCALVFTFDNEYSWFREKNISYRITITPPALKYLVNARKVRAHIALQYVLEDKQAAEKRLEKVASKRTSLLEEIEFLENELVEKKKSLTVVTNEEEWLIQRLALRKIQEEQIDKRKMRNWADENEQFQPLEEDMVHTLHTDETFEI